MLAKSKPKQFWKKIKHQYKTNTNFAQNLDISDLHSHFEKLYDDQTETILNNETPIPDVFDENLDMEISFQELKKAVFSQNNNKSSGIDTLIAEVFKHSFNEISTFLLTLFNKLFRNSEYPKSLGEGIIVPIYKGGDIENAKNYRGITLINILGKNYSQILLNRLTK